MCLQFGFVIFWQKVFSAKAAHVMLVKLTIGLPPPRQTVRWLLKPLRLSKPAGKIWQKVSLANSFLFKNTLDYF
jgi:hypothetical protein